MVLIGKRRNYLTIQVATRTADGQGGYVTTWTDTYYDWGRAVYLNGSKTLDGAGVKYKKAVEFTIRYRDYDLSEAHRIKWGDDYFTIHSVLPSEKNDDLKVLAYG